MNKAGGGSDRIEGNQFTANLQGVFLSGTFPGTDKIHNNTFRNNGAGINVSSAGGNVSNNYLLNNGIGVNVLGTTGLVVYNNFFNNSINAKSGVGVSWNISKTPGTNIFSGPFLGGNFWHDYVGVDVNGDGLGDTLLPHTSGGNILIGGDFLPLVPVNSNLATLSVSGSPNIGNTITFTLSDPGHPNTNYILALSASTTPGFMLSDGRVIPLTPDAFFFLSISFPAAIGLNNVQSALNAGGMATATWTIPAYGVPGFTVYFAFVTINPILPLPQAILSISNAVPVTLLP